MNHAYPTRLFARAILPAVVACALVLSGRAAGGDAEERTFKVLVEGKASGSYSVKYETRADGHEVVASHAAVKGRILVVSFAYDHQSEEVWDGAKVVSIESRTNDDGKKSTLAVAATADGLTVTAKGRSRTEQGTFLPSSGLKMPAVKGNEEAVSVLDTEDGTRTAAKLTRLGGCRVKLNGNDIPGERFGVTGKNLASEWWFDAAGRPIRQAMTWDGHKVVMELTAIKK